MRRAGILPGGSAGAGPGGISTMCWRTFRRSMPIHLAAIAGRCSFPWPRWYSGARRSRRGTSHRAKTCVASLLNQLQQLQQTDPNKFNICSGRLANAGIRPDIIMA